ncbi:MAG: SPOR domain-containing protein, partial [Planctomycetota bacterium]
EAGAGGRSWRLQQGIAAGALVAVLLVVAYLLGRGSASPPPVQGGGGDTFVASVPVGTAPEPSESRADGEQPRGGEPAARQVASRPRAAVAVPLGIAARVPEPASRPAASQGAGAGAEGGASSAPAQPAQPASLDGGGEPRWQIMVMSHVPKEGAERIRSYLESKGYRAYVQRSGRVYNVRVGDYHDKGSEVARRDLDALRALPYRGRLEFKSAWFVRWKKLR